MSKQVELTRLTMRFFDEIFDPRAIKKNMAR
jgi:hypothetical protein